MTPTTYTTSLDPFYCQWCEEAEATRRGYDEHNGPWHLCDECHAEAEAE